MSNQTRYKVSIRNWRTSVEIKVLITIFLFLMQANNLKTFFFLQWRKEIMDDEAETYKLWRIRKTIMQLCHDRGYLVTQDELDQTLDQFKEQFGDKPSERHPARSDLIVLVAHNDDPTDQMFVFFPDEPKVCIVCVYWYYFIILLQLWAGLPSIYTTVELSKFPHLSNTIFFHILCAYYNQVSKKDFGIVINKLRLLWEYWLFIDTLVRGQLCFELHKCSMPCFAFFSFLPKLVFDILTQCYWKNVVTVVLFCEMSLHICGSTGAYPLSCQLVDLVTSLDVSFSDFENFCYLPML